MSNTVRRIPFSESINGLPISVKNEFKNIHLVPEGFLDEIWAWISSPSSSIVSAFVRLNNIEFPVNVSSENSPVLVVPGITVSSYFFDAILGPPDPALRLSTAGMVDIYGYVNRIEK
jgi:hypothetical protein